MDDGESVSVTVKRGRMQSRGSRGGQSDSSHMTHKSVRSMLGEVVDDIATLLDAEVQEDLGIGKPIHTVAVIFNLSNTTMGVGILSLASAFAYAGLVLGPLLMIFCAAATYYSVMLLVRIVHINRVPADASGVPTMEAVAEYCLGRFGKVWIQSVLILICLGTLVAYLVSVKSLLYSGLKQILPSHTVDQLSNNGFNDQTVMLLGLVIVSLPLSLLRRLDGLWFTSFLSVLSLFYFIIITIEYIAAHPDVADVPECHDNNKTVHGKDSYLLPNDVPGAFEAFSIISVSYICQLTVFPILKELARGQRGGGGSDTPVKDASSQLMRAMWITMVIACTFYLIAGIAGYLTWRNVTTTPSTILACYPPDSASIVLVYFGMTAVLLFSFPLICFTARCTIHALIVGDAAAGIPLSTLHHVGLTLGISAPCALTAYYAKSLSTVLSIVSAVTSPSLCFLIPGLCYTLASLSEQKHFAEDTEKGRPIGESSRLVNLEGADPTAEETPQEAEFIRAERAKLRSSIRGGYIVTAIGAAMQIACIIGVGFTLSGSSDDSD